MSGPAKEGDALQMTSDTIDNTVKEIPESSFFN